MRSQGRNWRESQVGRQRWYVEAADRKLLLNKVVDYLRSHSRELVLALFLAGAAVGSSEKFAQLIDEAAAPSPSSVKSAPLKELNHDSKTVPPELLLEREQTTTEELRIRNAVFRLLGPYEFKNPKDMRLPLEKRKSKIKI